ncbi:sugar ABC transporter substrate-binding protein [Agrococcus sediminis]|uniref:Sugar ABC transporter substrate-binding protein n=1 Tax=Agrococcus sediminis TaxID=2599924 RepID=A0A5M8Q5S4_9MICO|nr:MULTISPECIES: multiple monosaccharide ABC transporter substrate-binding protein [Agrococcus]KAA6430150.1 sugar ABC transporter substrate-binding protein [Agrococcus sediminis]MDR7235190.1 putative multiple sugar transport system substrate-binding protein [Agrococcus sp. BE272]RWR25957.1 sugar ABC transporter substrate-binding protein [Agrococcus lahaulensis]UOW01300.1 sugar-binding protein [Agrococcus sp. SCSIO52902]
MKKHRILGAVAAAGVIALLATGCGRGGTAEPAASDGADTGGQGQIVGVAMPTQQSERWIADGANVQSQLEELGYTVDLQYANDDIPTQVSQIENMISSGAEALIIASIDGTTLTDVLAQAGDAGIPVIAYDRLINGSPNVDYYTTFDNYQVGVQQATSLLTGLGVLDESGERTDEAGPFNIELFAGSPDDNNATFFWNGAMDTLQPLIDEGVLEVPSGQVEFEQAAILRWLPETAQERMENILTVIGDTRLDGVLSPYDGLSIGIISALTSGGYSTDALPVITGQDAEVGSVQSIIAGEQYSTIFKDTRLLAEQAVAMVDALLSGEEPEVNDTETYDNGELIVPSYLLESTIVTVDNYEEVLIESGYYDEGDL